MYEATIWVSAVARFPHWLTSCVSLLQDVDIDGQSYTMTGLKKNTEYSFRVVANNKHGPGVSTEDVIVRTLSDG